MIQQFTLSSGNVRKVSTASPHMILLASNLLPLKNQSQTDTLRRRHCQRYVKRQEIQVNTETVDKATVNGRIFRK